MMDPSNEFDNGTADSVGGTTNNTFDVESGDDDALHDQLPSVEEYKSNMANNGSPSKLSAAHANSQGGASMDGGDAVDDDDDYDDDDDEYVHDQLPGVDEIRAASKSTGDKSWGALYYFAIFVGLVVVTVIIVVPTILTQDKDSTETASSAQQSPVPAPTRAPVAPPTQPPLERKDSIVKYLADLGITNEIEMTLSGTPQNRAVEWMAFDDEYKMEVPSTPKRYSPFVERYALAVFFFSTNGPSWTYKMQFLTGIDHCEWHDDFLTNTGAILRLGVSECNSAATSESVGGGQLAKVLSLPSNKLIGSISSEFRYLHRLETVFMPFNPQLTGDLEFGLPFLDRLKSFEVQYCGFTGFIPDQIGSLRQLTTLGLGNNKLEGTLPASFFELTDLELIGLDDNLLEADLASFGNFTKVKQAYLEDNLFTGELTESLVDNWAANLEELDLSRNNINSTIPAGLFNMTNLEVMDLHANSLRGPIPDLADSNGSLQFLALHDNDLTGQIPLTISNLRTLRHLDLAKNKLTTPLPESMGLMTDLMYLYMGQNDFSTHAMPEFLWSLTRLRELSMKSNMITGTIPSEIRTLSVLQLLDLDSNRLTGTIPDEVGLLHGLDYLLLNRNSLSGTLPSTFTLLYDLNMLLIDHNKINGTADVICNDTNIDLNYFVADCEGPIVNIECSCCDLCCNDLNATCNNLGWHVNLDPIWEYGYARNSYQFSQETLASEP